MIFYVTAEVGLTRISKDTDTGAIIFTPSFAETECHNLAEHDQIVVCSGAYVNVECSFPVTAADCSRVFAFWGAHIDGLFGSEVIAEQGAFVRAENGCYVTAYDGSRIEALPGSHVKARFGSHVVVHPGAVIDEFGGATVVDPSGDAFALLRSSVPNRMMGR